MVVFHKLCRTAWSSRVHKTESVLVMALTRSAAVCSTGWTRNGELCCICLIDIMWISLNVRLDYEKMWLNIRVNFLLRHVVKCRLCDIVAVRNDVLYTIYDGLAQGLLESAAVQRNAVSSLLLLTCWFVWCCLCRIMSFLLITGQKSASVSVCVCVRVLTSVINHNWCVSRAVIW